MPCRYSLPTIFVIFFSGLAVDALGLWLSCLIFGAFVLASSLIWYTALQASAAAGGIFVVGLLAQGLLGVGGESLFVAQKALLVSRHSYRWHLGCILLKMPAISLRTGGLIRRRAQGRRALQNPDGRRVWRLSDHGKALSRWARRCIPRNLD